MTFCECHSDLFHRAAAAFLAIALRLVADSFAARALPPLAPPSRPSATAAGFFPSSGSTSGGASPTLMSTMGFASWFMSRGRFGLLERLPESRVKRELVCNIAHSEPSAEAMFWDPVVLRRLEGAVERSFGESACGSQCADADGNDSRMESASRMELNFG